MEAPSLVLLGCRLGGGGALSPTAERRAARAALAFRSGAFAHILACGGKAWSGVREADALCAFLIELGVPAGALEGERSSHTTCQNARYAAGLLLPRGRRQIGLVTCDWHMARALRLFRGAGFDPVPVPAASPPVYGLQAWRRSGRERLALWSDAALTLGFARI